MRSKTPLTVTVLGGIAALVLAGCNNNPGGTAGPATSTTTAATSSAPAIANPLDTTKLQQNLCAGLTPEQVAPYMGQVKNTSTDNQSKYSTCNLYPTDVTQASVSISVYPNLSPSGMIASGKDYPYSKNLGPIQGYPAQDTSQLNPPNGDCGTAVSVSDNVVVEVSVQQANKSSQYNNNTCAASEALAPLLLGNIKASG